MKRSMWEEFRKAFKPTPEEKEAQRELNKKIVKEAVEAKACCSCEAYIPDEPIADFVDPDPQCRYGGSAIKTCHRYKMNEFSKKILEE